MDAVTSRVVLTRQPEQAGDLEAGLVEAGYAVRFLPLTDFELPSDTAPLGNAVRRLAAEDYAWLLVTSPNTVRALVRCGWDGSLPGATRVAVTGPGTARVLAEAGCGVLPWMPAGDASAAGILARFPAPGPANPRLLLPQSALATEEVADGLRRRGWAVDRVQAYRTVPFPADPARRLLAGPAGSVVGLDEVAGAVVVLTSPSAARELGARLDGAEPPPGTALVAIGQPTRRACRDLGLPLAGTAATPDADGILAILSGRRSAGPG